MPVGRLAVNFPPDRELIRATVRGWLALTGIRPMREPQDRCLQRTVLVPV